MDYSGTTGTYFAHPSMMRAHPFRFLLYLALVPFFGAGLILLAKWYFKRFSVTLKIDEASVSVVRGLINRCSTTIPIEDVAAISICQTWFQRLMCVGKISISSAGEDGYQIQISAVSYPNQVRQFIEMHRCARLVSFNNSTL